MANQQLNRHTNTVLNQPIISFRDGTEFAAPSPLSPFWGSSRWQRWSSIRLLWNLLRRSKKQSSSEGSRPSFWTKNDKLRHKRNSTLLSSYHLLQFLHAFSHGCFYLTTLSQKAKTCWWGQPSTTGVLQGCFFFFFLLDSLIISNYSSIQETWCADKWVKLEASMSWIRIFKMDSMWMRNIISLTHRGRLSCWDYLGPDTKGGTVS